MAPQTAGAVEVISFVFCDGFPWHTVCSVGIPPWVRWTRTKHHRTPSWMDPQALTLFKPSRVNAKPILKPINIPSILLIAFNMQRIPRVCSPTFPNQPHL